MKHAGLTIGSIAVLVSIALLSGCFTGLEPVRNDTSTSITISFAQLPAADGSSPERAAIQGGGFLYIQIGNTSKARLYGPYTVDSRNTVTITDIPPGTHGFFEVIYSSVAQASLAPITDAADTADFRTKLRLMLSEDGATSYQILANVTIAEKGQNTINCLLAPLERDSLDYGYGLSYAPLRLPAATKGSGHQFVALNDIGSTPAALARSAKLNVTNTSSAYTSIQNLALYTSDGALVLSAASESLGNLAPGTTATVMDMSSLTGNSYVLYARYSGSGLSLSVDASWNARFLFVTSDGNAVRTINGSDWAVSATGLASCSDVVYAPQGFIACGLTASGYVAISTSKDGYAWKVNTTDPVHTSNYGMRLAIRPSDGKLALAYISGATGYASTSTDDWATVNMTGIAGGISGLEWVTDKWIATSGGSGWRGSPDGVTWSTASLGSAAMYSMATVRLINGVLLAGGGLPNADGKTIFRSTNGGLTWGSVITLPTTSTYTRVEAFIPTDSGRILAVGGGTAPDMIWYSDDQGSVWAATTAPVNSGKFLSGAQTAWGVFIGHDSGQLFRSPDNGASFSLVTAPTTGSVVAMTRGAN